MVMIVGQEARHGPRLTDFAENTYSQFGEDGIIDHIFDVIGTTSRLCIEFGAGDGLDCSNVAKLWKHEWQAELIESDPVTYAKLESNTDSVFCATYNQKIEPTGKSSLDALYYDYSPLFDFMSMDIDGNEIHVWRHLKMAPRVISIEFNPTVPPHISLYQEYTTEDMGFGASLGALREMSKIKGYEFIGASYCNAFFVRKDVAEPFKEYDTTIEFEPTYLVTDFKGSALAVGRDLPWGIRTPYTGPNVVGETHAIKSNDPLGSYEERYGNAVHWVQARWPNIADPDENIPRERGHNARGLLTFLMESNLSPICIDIAHVSSVEHLDWIRPLAEERQYQFRIGENMLALVRL